MLEPEIIDEEKYYSKEGITPRQLILSHIDRISRYIFKGEDTPTKDEKGNFRTPDRRIVVISAIEFFTSILKPYYDKGMKEQQEKFDKQILKLEKILLRKSIHSEAYKKANESKRGNFNINYHKWKKFLISQGILLIDKFSGHFEFYISIKYKSHLKLFEKQNQLLYRKNFLTSLDLKE